MIPFQFKFKPGIPVFEQVIYAVKKALVSSQLATGDKFPSVRQLSQELKINPNTAHKAIMALVEDGILTVRPGIGTVVAEVPPATRQQKRSFLTEDLEQLVVEARKLSLELPEVEDALRQQWNRFTKEK